jgi:hypothetical protein
MGRSGLRLHIRGRARKEAVVVDILLSAVGDVGGDVRRAVPKFALMSSEMRIQILDIYSGSHQGLFNSTAIEKKKRLFLFRARYLIDQKSRKKES